MKICPLCKLVSSDDAKVCDCGYDFELERKGASYLLKKTGPRVADFTQTAVCFVLGGVLFIAGSTAAPAIRLLRTIGLGLIGLSVADCIRVLTKPRRAR